MKKIKVENLLYTGLILLLIAISIYYIYKPTDTKKIPELEEQYSMQLGYFKNNFYRNSLGREDTQKAVYSITSVLDTLLRHSGVKHILCNRTNNINFDDALKNGEVTIVCTRRGDLGARST